MNIHKPVISTKRIQVDKANTTTVIVIALAVAVGVFSIVASRSLISQAAYQNKVLGERRKSEKVLKANSEALKQLVSQYTVFAKEDTNVLGGSRTGSGALDGDNAKIVLDALPSKYDFPALTSSIEKLVTGRKLTVTNINGTDDELNQLAPASSTPASVVMNFSVSTKGSYPSIKDLATDFERSIRPFDLVTMKLKGTDAALEAEFTYNTYYQPAKNLSITDKVIK